MKADDRIRGMKTVPQPHSYNGGILDRTQPSLHIHAAMFAQIMQAAQIGDRGSVRSILHVLAPIQIECHPGKTCFCSCNHCLGSSLRKKVIRALNAEALLPLVHGMSANAVPRLELSGIFTDPVSNPHLAAIVAECQLLGIAFGIHSKCLSLPNTLIDVLSRTRNEDCNVAVSLDRFNRAGYQTSVRPIEGMGFTGVIRNTELLVDACASHGSTLKIDLRTLLLFSATETELERYQAWVLSLQERYENVFWRLATPWSPTASNPQSTPMGYLATVPVHLRKCLQKVVMETPKTQLRSTSLKTSAEYCYNQLLYGAIGASGAFYPCQGIASPDYDHLSYGNLWCDDFFEAWRSRTADVLMRSIPGKACPGCAAPCEKWTNDYYANLV